MVRVTARRHFVKIETSWAVVVGAGAVVFTLLVTAGSLAVTARSARDEAERRACAARLEAFRSRNALLLGRRDVGEPCSYLRMVTGEQP